MSINSRKSSVSNSQRFSKEILKRQIEQIQEIDLFPGRPLYTKFNVLEKEIPVRLKITYKSYPDVRVYVSINGKLPSSSNNCESLYNPPEINLNSLHSIFANDSIICGFFTKRGCKIKLQKEYKMRNKNLNTLQQSLPT